VVRGMSVDCFFLVGRASLRLEIYLRLWLRPSCADAGSTTRARRVAGNSNHMIKRFNPELFFQLSIYTVPADARGCVGCWE
jgi:hypothetical protein